MQKNSPNTKQPVFFISHGAPDVLLSNPEVAKGWRQQIKNLPRPEAVVLISAHWLTRQFCVGGNSNKKTIHDFNGFSEKLYDYEYPSPSAIDLADELHESLGLVIKHDRGLDHGAWVPLIAMYPGHDIPVVQISISPDQDATEHFMLGQKLAFLREKNIMVIASGGIVHNLSKLKWNEPSASPDLWAKKFVQEVLAVVKDKNWDLLMQPETINNFCLAHPSLEHFLPLLVSVGAGENDDASTFCNIWRYGNLGMQSIRFG